MSLNVGNEKTTLPIVQKEDAIVMLQVQETCLFGQVFF
jgi:hypothetical protein